MHRSIFLIWLLLHCTFFHSSAISSPPSEKIVFLSDTQDPIWFERIFLAGNRNTTASDLILNQIVDEDIKAVFHLGDLVSIGYDQKGWYRIDRFLSQLKTRHIPFYPTLGNHELFLFSESGASEFMSRFPEYKPTGYMIRIGPVAVIMLNSNFGYPDDDQVEQQQIWYTQILDSCQNDTSVKAVIVGCHHPPYTNSRIVSANEDVQKYFLPEFINSSKTKLFLSGHAHAFEHFQKNSKDFMVIGGGGGLQHPLGVGDQSEFEDQFAGGEKRGFHYLGCVLSQDHMKLNINMLKDDFSDFEVIYSMVISY